MEKLSGELWEGRAVDRKLKSSLEWPCGENTLHWTTACCFVQWGLQCNLTTNLQSSILDGVCNRNVKSKKAVVFLVLKILLFSVVVLTTLMQ